MLGSGLALLTEIGTLQPDPVLEHLAIRSLSDPDPEVAQNAAAYLGSYGSAGAEQALWDRYEAWSREWSGREKELRFVYAGENPNVWQEGLGENLARALASGLGWLSDENKSRRIEALAVGSNITQNVENALKAWVVMWPSTNCIQRRHWRRSLVNFPTGPDLFGRHRNSLQRPS